MSQKATRAVILVALVCGCGGTSALALAQSRARVDLHITAGSVRITRERVRSSGDREVLTGSFTVRNGGTAPAASLRAWIGLSASGRHRVLHHLRHGRLRPGGQLTFHVALRMPSRLAKVNWTVRACVLGAPAVGATPASRTCRSVGRDDLAPTPPHSGGGGTATSTRPTPGSTSTPGTPTATTTTTATATAPATTTATGTTPAPSQVPSQPITGYSTNSPYFVGDGLGQYDGRANAAGTAPTPAYADYAGGFFTSGYWTVVPPSYDRSNHTPETLVVWMHGCGGAGAWDAQDLTGQYNADRPYILISLNGPEAAGDGGPDCWDTADQADVAKVLTDVANVETHFNIDRRRIILAGYSSGGDLAYQTIFLHADTFAGILAMNTDPVRDNTFGGDLAGAMAGAAWHFPILHVAHDADGTYPPSTVTPHLNALSAAGFPVQYAIRSGTHYDDDTPANCNDTTPGTCTGGTATDIVEHLLDSSTWATWEAPAP